MEILWSSGLSRLYACLGAKPTYGLRLLRRHKIPESDFCIADMIGCLFSTDKRFEKSLLTLFPMYKNVGG